MNYRHLKALGISGSLRTDSLNRKALQVSKRFAAELGAQVDEIDLKELALPIYDEDVQTAGFPEPVRKLKQAVESTDLLLIATPEYNYSISAALKNAIEWLSRGKNSLDNKVAAIFGASGGPFGTLRGQFQLRHILTSVNVYTVPQPQVFIRSARDAFRPDGTLADKELENQLKSLVTRSLSLAGALRD
jgi:chromate reductase